MRERERDVGRRYFTVELELNTARSRCSRVRFPVLILLFCDEAKV